MSLLEFQIDIASCLVQAGKLPVEVMRHKCRPSLSSEPKPKRSKTCAANPIPSNDIRYDALGHFINMDEKQHRWRYCSEGSTKLRCMKCEMFLCITQNGTAF